MTHEKEPLVRTVHAHCDGPCGVYDPAAARITAEAVLSMAKKISALKVPDPTNAAAYAAYLNTVGRYVSIKEEQAEQTKHELLVLWTDYFKPKHLEQFPDLHEVFWNAAKLCSECKQHVSVEYGERLLETVERVHGMFWKSKGRDVPWMTAG